jgi:hypothetical protein
MRIGTWNVRSVYRVGSLKTVASELPLGVDRKITLEWILGKLGGKLWTGCNWLRIETKGGGIF